MEPHFLRVFLTATPSSTASPTNVVIRARVERSQGIVRHTIQASSIVISERPLPAELAPQLQLLKDVEVKGGLLKTKPESEAPSVQILLNQLLQATTSQINVGESEQLSGTQLNALILEVAADAVTILARVVHRPVFDARISSTEPEKGWLTHATSTLNKYLPSLCHLESLSISNHAKEIHKGPLVISYTGPVRLQPGVELLVGEIVL